MFQISGLLLLAPFFRNVKLMMMTDDHWTWGRAPGGSIDTAASSRVGSRVLSDGINDS